MKSILAGRPVHMCETTILFSQKVFGGWTKFQESVDVPFYMFWDSGQSQFKNHSFDLFDVRKVSSSDAFTDNHCYTWLKLSSKTLQCTDLHSSHHSCPHRYPWPSCLNSHPSHWVKLLELTRTIWNTQNSELLDSCSLWLCRLLLEVHLQWV